MRSNRYFLFLILVLGFSANLFSQGIAIGEWRSHLPYQRVIDVELADQKVYAATPYDLFVYDKTDHSLSILNKVNGLNDIGIKKISYSSAENTLLIAYSNTNIDLVKGYKALQNEF